MALPVNAMKRLICCCAVWIAFLRCVAQSTVVGWGDNSYNEINIPPGLTNVLAVATGQYHSLALLSNGIVVAWGAGTNVSTTDTRIAGQCIVPPGLSNVVAVAGGEGFHTLALKNDGTVIAWGAGGTNSGSNPNYWQSMVPFGLSNVAAIAPGGYHSLVLRSNGTVLAWGAGSNNAKAFPNFGQSAVPFGLSNIVAIAGGIYHSLALKSDGTVVAWGAGTNNTGVYPNYGQCIVPRGLSNVTAIAAGGHHSLALRSNGTIVAWGYNGDGETNIPAGLSNVVRIAAGSYHNLALKADGMLVAWGLNSAGQTNVPSGLSNPISFACGYGFCLAQVLPPMNDNFTNATEILSDNVTLKGSNVGASREPGEPYHAHNPGGASVWWKWTAPESSTVTLNYAFDSGQIPLVSVYTATTSSISNLTLVADDYSNTGAYVQYNSPIRFTAIAGTAYYIAVDGPLDPVYCYDPVNLFPYLCGYSGVPHEEAVSLSLSECIPPKIEDIETFQTTESNGIHVHFCATISGNVSSFDWSVTNNVPFITTIDEGNCFEVVVSPTNELDVVVSLNPTGPCGSDTGGAGPVTTCGICLSLGTPSLLTSTTGSGNGPVTNTKGCGMISAQAKWYKMISTNGTGMVTISTENSGINTIIGIYTNSLIQPVPWACGANRLTFNAVQGLVYWIAIDPSTNSTTNLRVASGFEPHIANYGLNPDGTFWLQSTPTPPIPFTLLSTTNLALNLNNWSVVLKTNLAANVYYRETNTKAWPRRFYRLAP